jgi:hypothetical protein
MSKINEFIEALREGNGYTWISNHGWELGKEELINIIKEYDYAIHSQTMTSDEENDIYTAAAEELEAMYGEE